ncbi:MAG: hypothetical protein WC114_12720, partial [Smithellaceae bacterium]
IVPNYFLSTDNDAALRKFLFENNKAKIILNVKDVFISATVFCAILVIEKGGISNNIDFYERTTPDGHLKIPHPWPGQNPPP